MGPTGAPLVQDDHLTVQDGGPAQQCGGRIGNPGIVARPVVAPARIGAYHVTLQDELRAIAVVLDFVNPFAALWRLIGQARELRWDELQAGLYAIRELLM